MVATKSTNVAPTNVVKILLCLCRGVLRKESKQKVVKMFPGKKVITPILDTSTFYPIAGDEIYHQDYYKKSPLRYKFYRYSCGRDARLKEIWGDKATH